MTLHHRQRLVEVYRVHPIILWVTVFAALLLQAFLPVMIPQARFFDFPLLVVIYFSLLRRSKMFGIGLGTAVGLVQDALSHHYIGLYGMAKALIGYLAASGSVKFDLEQLVARFILTGILVLVHGFFLLGVEHALLEFPPPFVPLDLATNILFNVSMALILFQLLDRFKRRV
jgi:rod shape-determining protein MreD